MECEEKDNSGVNVKSVDETSAVVNSVILDYYKKFGRKRDLEQYFSLSSAETEVRDVSSLFWRRMKSQTDSSDSGDRKSESSTELCRISIKCSLPEPCSSQDDNTRTKSDSESPPIIVEEVTPRHTDEESANEFNDDNQSQKSIDVTLDTSMNKPLSPTSSVTSQRKLEWDSLADVGYGNESDRKTSASSLSTLERLALKQQYSNNDSKENNEMGPPTAHSTPVEGNDSKNKSKKGGFRKTTKIYKKETDIVEVSVPKDSENSPPQAINVNLTKHISFNMEKDGSITLDNIKQDLNIKPDNAALSPVSEGKSQVKMDKRIQTTQPKHKEQPSPKSEQSPQIYYQKVPVLISLNTLKKRFRKKKLKVARRKLRSKKKNNSDKENIPQEKSMEQVSAAESFEYMPGHVYNQNQMNQEQPRSSNNNTGNKSSLESSGAVTTTESSKDSRHSFTKDLEKSIDLLKAALKKSNDDAELKNKLVKEVVQRLLKSKYRDEESTTDFLSGLSFSSKKLGLGESQFTTSTSDSNNTDTMPKKSYPRKSILRLDKFNANILASTSQSAPNLPSVSNSKNPIAPNALKSNNLTESDMSSGGKHSSDTAFAKTSSEELYQKYLEALRREQAYKKHLKDKEMFLKQKLVCSDTAVRVPPSDSKVNNKLKDLIKDLTRNNYDDGSGDASKLEGGSNPNLNLQGNNAVKKHRSHSVFTLSSGNSDDNRKANLRKQLQNEMKEAKAGPSRDEHQCCCPRQFVVPKVIDSSVQVNFKSICGSAEKQRQVEKNSKVESLVSDRNSPREIAHVVSDDAGDIKYVCLCNNKSISQQEVSDNMLIYKCSRLTTKGVQLDNAPSKISNNVGVQCMGDSFSKNCESHSTSMERREVRDNRLKLIHSSSSENMPEMERISKTSQTNLPIQMLRKSSVRSFTSSSSAGKKTGECSLKSLNSDDVQNKVIVHEATRSVQTEISFNPRIADPSLTDINIISDIDCVKVINERYRETSKKNSEADIRCPKIDNNKLDSSDDSRSSKRKCVCSENVKSNHSSPRTVCPTKVNKEIQSDIEPNNNVVKQKTMTQNEECASDNFTIPIQGTNMTLMVKIGSKTTNTGEEKKCEEFVTQCVGTDKTDTTEKETNLREECSKGVQSQTTNIFACIEPKLRQSPQEPVDIQPFVESKKYPSKQDIMEAFNKCCLVNTFVGENEVRSTYPRSVQINPKPFLRSNTDSGKFVAGACVQTDSIEQIDAVTQQDPQIEKEKQNPLVEATQQSKEMYLEEANSKSCSDESSKADIRKEQKESSSEAQSRKSSTESDKDPVLDIIKNITKRYSKKDIDRNKKKKCFKEIVTVLNYLLDTEEGLDIEQLKMTDSSSNRDTDSDKTKKPKDNPISSKISSCQTSPMKVDKAVQLSPKPQTNKRSTESSEIQATTDVPGTSSDSATCKVLNKIKRECEKYHQKRCKSLMSKKCDPSSSTSVNCEQCKRVHHCPCRGHRCHKSKASGEKKKKCVAYNLIIQTSDSMISEENAADNGCKPLQNIVVKVPSRKKHMEKVPFKEVSAKIEKNMPRCSPRSDARTHRSRSLPNDSSSVDDSARTDCGRYTVRDYLEKNRPDFVEKTSTRQQCLKIISEKRATDRATHRQLLSVQLARETHVSALSDAELTRLARDLGVYLRSKKLAPKFISERDMKKHSEMIYKSLPEVVQKKEEIKKENLKKTNLLMANIFKKNLQKKTLRGAVNLSNYNTVIKI